jgi:hypothetical protein
LTSQPKLFKPRGEADIPGVSRRQVGSPPAGGPCSRRTPFCAPRCAIIAANMARDLESRILMSAGEVSGAPAMRRLLALWLVLAAAFWVGRIAVSLTLFYSLDLTFRSFVELIVVPGLQAAAVTWATRLPAGPGLLAPWRQVLTSPPWRVILACDLAVLGATWLALGLAAGPPALRFGARAGLPLAALSAKLAAAAALLAVAGWRRLRGAGPRLGTLTLSAVLATLAAEPVTRWLENGPQRLFPDQPPLVRWVRFYLPALLALLLALFAAQSALWKASPAAGRAVDWAVAAVLVLAAIVVGGFFLHPYLRDPWRSAAWTAGYVAASALLVAAALAARKPAELLAGDPPLPRL